MRRTTKHRRNHTRRLPLTAVAIVGMLLALGAWGANAALEVRVIDASGNPLPGVTVTIEHPDGRVPKSSAVTDTNGVVRFPGLRPGEGYVVEVAFAGFASRRVTDVRVSRTGNEVLTVAMVRQPAQRLESAAVTSEKKARFSDGYRPVPGGHSQNVLTRTQGAQGVGVDSSFNGTINGGRPTPVEGEAANTEAYDHLRDNPFLEVRDAPLSTFSIDVDTASYSNVRRFLDGGELPPPGAVRIEELVNYFRYDYPGPVDTAPFGIDVEVSEAPWAPAHRLARIGIQGLELDPAERPASNLVFLLDVSGSMNQANKLPLVRTAMKMLTAQLGANDRVAIVVYAGAAGVVLPSVYGDDRAAILDAIERLRAGGSTAGGAGIRLAYKTARENFVTGGTNRVILCTDGDFNVGVTNQSELVELIGREAKAGVFLTVLGFGMGNYKDSTLEKLADNGNGNYAYIDTRHEARKVLVEQIGSTLVTIAKDVKIQVEFNPAEVAAYRLIGYENRMLHARDFNDDTKDAGEIGAGHSVTALYELVPAGQAIDGPSVDPLRYQTVKPTGASESSGELLTVKVRYKKPDGDTSKLLTLALHDPGTALIATSDDFRFAAAVAAFGMRLRDSEHLGDFDGRRILELARESLGSDAAGHRAGFVRLVEQVEVLRSAVAGLEVTP